jgi:hypothetical protein
MLSHETAAATRKTGRLCTVALGVMLYANAHIALAGTADSPIASPGNALLDGYLRDTRDPWAPPPAQYRFVVGSSSDANARVDASSSEFLARLRRAFGIDPGHSNDRAHRGEREVLLSNSDALFRARIRLTSGNEQFAFVYADMGARDSALKWQGLAGIRGGHGVDLLGGWRRVTYPVSPGGGFDLLDFNGPYLGATFAW